MNTFTVTTPSIAFVEPSERVNKLISEHTSMYVKDIILKRNRKELNVKYMKVISYLYDCDDHLVIVDEHFNDMFSTAFAKISNLPDIFIARLDTYKMVVYLLYKQLKFVYDEKDIVVSKFRREVYDKISNLTTGHFELS